MQQEVYGEVVTGEIVGVEPVIPTAQPVVGVQPSYAAEPVGSYKGYGEVAPPPPPPRIIDSRLVLVRRGSPNVLRFDHWQALQAGSAAPLTVDASHPGNGIGTMYPEERRFQEWRYTESKCVAARDACSVQLVQGKFLKRVDANLVLDVAFWKFHEGTAVNWVGGGSDDRTYLHGGGRDFRVNSDGSICLVNHPVLCLGVIDPESQAHKSDEEMILERLGQWARSRNWRDHMAGPFKEGLLSYAFLAIGFSLLLGPGVWLIVRVGLCWVAIPGLMAAAPPGTAIVAFLCFLVGIIVYRCIKGCADVVARIEAIESTSQVMQNPPPPRHDLLNTYSGEIGICVLLFYFFALYQHSL